MPDYETIKLAEISVRIREVGTLENAKKYFETTDKYVFCLDLLDLSLTHDGHAIVIKQCKFSKNILTTNPVNHDKRMEDLDWAANPKTVWEAI